jgi:hypothetical protein
MLASYYRPLHSECQGQLSGDFMGDQQRGTQPAERHSE